jgi:hypothetical protein
MRHTVLIQILNERGIFPAQGILAEGDHIASVSFPDIKCLVDDSFKAVTDNLNEPEQEYLSKHSRKIL